MGFLARGLERKSVVGTINFRDLLFGGGTSYSGKTVNEQTALEVATVFACLRVRANGVAQVPLKLMRESKDGRSRAPAREHPLYKILGSRPNDWQTSFEYREMLMLHLGLCNEHFSFINRSNRSGIMELIPFEPGMVTVRRADDYTLTYEVRAANGSTQIFPAKAIWHVRGPSWNSWCGIPAVQVAREAIGLSMAAEEHQARLHKNGVRTSGVYAVDGALNDQQYKALRKWIDDEMAGAANAGKSMILDRGAKWLNTSMTGVDAQTQDLRRFQVEEMCRALGVNPIMVYAESKNITYASAEQQFLAHVVHTVAPDYSRIEQSIDANLLTDADRADGLYANFVEEGLLRGSMVETKDTLLGYVNGGLMTPNEGRAKLDMNPDTDPASDKLRIPANITGSVPVANPAPDPAQNKRMADLETQVSEFKSRPTPAPAFHVTLNQDPVTVKVDPSTISVTMPEIKAAPAPNVQVDVHVPQAPAPEVKVDVNVPAGPAPEVNVQVDNHVPQQPAPNVTLEATLPTPQVVVQLPARKTHTETAVTRDKDGNIIGSSTDGTEKDA